MGGAALVMVPEIWTNDIARLLCPPGVDGLTARSAGVGCH